MYYLLDFIFNYLLEALVWEAITVEYSDLQKFGSSPIVIKGYPALKVDLHLVRDCRQVFK
jgi:hypothetical protein